LEFSVQFFYSHPMNDETLSPTHPHELLSPAARATLQKASLSVTPQGLLDTFLSKSRNACTRKAYTQDLNDFRNFLHLVDTLSAVAFLLTLPVGQANALAASYLNHLRSRSLSAATCNRRLDTLASLVKLAAKVGLVAYQLQPDRLPSERYRDTRGPGKEGVQQLLAALKERGGDHKQKRDVALIKILFDLALRQNEALSLDLEHLNRKQKTISIIGKGHTERLSLRLPEPTYQALIEWIGVRGEHDGPLFVSLDYSAPGHRLTAAALHKLLDQLGKKLGLKVRPHGLRHAAITAALEATGGNVRAVQKFSRHKDLNVLCVYDDNRKDVGGEIAKMIAQLT
jgi:integrase/recombinase XerC